MVGLKANEREPVLDRLGSIARGRGLDALSRRLSRIGKLVRSDLEELEQELALLERDGDCVEKSATHLMSRPGKRLRPLCVMLASRVGAGGGQAALDLAVAVELVHDATLLHDDVVDVGDSRRGAPAARVLYGNAASVFAGDWLLVEALRRVRKANVPGTLDRLLDTIDTMIRAEALQLERRGTALDREEYLRVIDGKTASLFRWAFWAGGRSGGCEEEECAALERFGHHLGVAFQVVDDVLDLTGDAGEMGKSLFADLREGKFTYPLLLGLERETRLAPLVRALLAVPDGTVPDEVLCGEIVELLKGTGAIEASMQFAQGQSDVARGALATFPRRGAVKALDAVAAAAVERRA